MAEAKRAIAVFAHNEEQNIIRCLQSVKDAAKDTDECFVLNNGSTDRTSEVVTAFIQDDPRFHLVEISLGDKSNAWNVFVHDINPLADLYVFLDGDCWIDKWSLNALADALDRHPEANAAAGMPASVVSSKFRQMMIEQGGVAGNLYALSSHFVTRLRSLEVYLPVGLIGDDSLIGALAYWSLDPQSSWVKAHVVSCPEANFYYQRLSPLSISDVHLLYRRKIRYSLRRFQNLALKDLMRLHGLKAIPRIIDDALIANQGVLTLRWRSLDTYFDFIALQRIRRTLHAADSAKADFGKENRIQ